MAGKGGRWGGGGGDGPESAGSLQIRHLKIAHTTCSYDFSTVSPAKSANTAHILMVKIFGNGTRAC